MSEYKYNSVEDIRTNLPTIRLAEINPAVAMHDYWDHGPKDEMQQIMDNLTAHRINDMVVTTSPFYKAFFRFHGIDPQEIKPSDIRNFPYTMKDSGIYGPGFRTMEMEQPYCLQDPGANGKVVFIGSTTGSSNNQRCYLPNTQHDMDLEGYRLAGIFKQIGFGSNTVALNLYNAATMGARTFEDAVKFLKGYNIYPQPGYELSNEDASQTLLKIMFDSRKNSNFPGGINAIFGVPRAAGDPHDRKGFVRIEDLVLDQLIPSGYLDKFNESDPFLIYAVGAGLSLRLMDELGDRSGIILVSGYGLQEIRPDMSGFGGPMCSRSDFHITVFPADVHIIDSNKDNKAQITDVGRTGEIALTVLKEASPIINYATGDLVEVRGSPQECCGRTGMLVSGVKRASSTDKVDLGGCRA